MAYNFTEIEKKWQEYWEKNKMDTNEEKSMFEITEIQEIMSHFGLSVQGVTNFYDTSHNDEDKRLNYILDDKYVLKINSVGVMWEERLQEIHRLI